MAIDFKNKLIENIALKYNVDKKEVEKAVNFQFKMVKHYMEQMQEVRLPFYGVFKINKKRKQKLEEIYGKNERRNSD